ncbi:hypothetical protein [Mesorhizobium sp. A556]
MSKNSKKPAAAEISASEEIAFRAIEINRTLTIDGEHHRAETIFTDLSPELADEIVAAGYGEYVDVGIPVDEIVVEGGNPVDVDGTVIGDGDQDEIDEAA